MLITNHTSWVWSQNLQHHSCCNYSHREARESAELSRHVNNKVLLLFFPFLRKYCVGASWVYFRSLSFFNLMLLTPLRFFTFPSTSHFHGVSQVFPPIAVRGKISIVNHLLIWKNRTLKHKAMLQDFFSISGLHLALIVIIFNLMSIKLKTCITTDPIKMFLHNKTA